MSLLQRLGDEVVDRFGEHLLSAPQITHDALLLEFANGVRLQSRLGGPGEYCLSWRFGDVEQRIDTAPVHPDLATFPNHLHGADGAARPDPLTRTDRPAIENIAALIEVLLRAPESLT